MLVWRIRKSFVVRFDPVAHSGDSRIKKVAISRIKKKKVGHCGAKEKVGGATKLSTVYV